MLRQKYITPQKLVILALATVGITLFISGGRAYAFNCPDQSADATVDGDWGIQNGGIDHDFTSVAVYAYNAKTGDALNVQYRMNSSANRSYSYGPPPVGDDGKQVPASLWPNAQIFKVHVDGTGTTVTDDALSAEMVWYGREFRCATKVLQRLG